VTENGSDASTIEQTAVAQDRGFYSLLFLAQSLGEHHFTETPQITVVANNLQEVTVDDKLCAEKATVLGPVKVIPQEYLNITCRSIDVVLPESGSSQERKLIDHLWADVTATSSDITVAYRGGHRWVQSFEPIHVNESAKELSHLREKGSYLIAGGLEGIGLVLAEYLAQSVKARLILTTNSEIPARDRYETWLRTHGEQNDVSRQIRKVQELEILGAEVLAVTADVTRQSQMEAVFTQAEERFGPLNGVIYAAGNFGRASLESIEETDKSKCERQFQASIYGPLTLEKILLDKKLDWCLLVSSLSSVLGGLGLVAYSAANTFLDAFACQKNRSNALPWISVNWDSWKFGGERQEATAFKTQLDELSITPTEGVEAFERIVSCDGLSQVIISTVDLQARITQWVTRESIREQDQAGQEESITFHARPNLLTLYTAPRNEVEQTLVEVWQKLVGIDQVGIHDNFFELGGDSLLAVQVISRVREKFEIDFPLTNLFEQPTVAALAEHIEISRWKSQTPFTETDLEDREEFEL
jgi:NAD(P)-dependent dehydrogenase (short-subunit alcohol dehydrogenase family)/acyl carrier protein